MKTAGVGTAALAAQAIAAPAIAQEMPEIKWRLTSSFPKNLDIATTTSDEFVRRVGELTSNKLQIKWFAPGEVGLAGGRRRVERHRRGPATPRATTMSARIRPSPSPRRCRSG